MAYDNSRRFEHQMGGPNEAFNCDKKSTISIAHNPIQHGCTKHVEVDGYFIKEKHESGLVCTPYISMEGQDFLTRGLACLVFQRIVSKLRESVGNLD